MNIQANWYSVTFGLVVAEWLRRWARNPSRSPHAGPNPADNERHPSTVVANQWHVTLYQVADVPTRTLLYNFIRYWKPPVFTNGSLCIYFQSQCPDVLHDLQWIFSFTSDGGIVVSIAAFQAVDLGSIPSHRSQFLPVACFICQEVSRKAKMCYVSPMIDDIAVQAFCPGLISNQCSCIYRF